MSSTIVANPPTVGPVEQPKTHRSEDLMQSLCQHLLPAYNGVFAEDLPLKFRQQSRPFIPRQTGALASRKIDMAIGRRETHQRIAETGPSVDQVRRLEPRHHAGFVKEY